MSLDRQPRRAPARRTATSARGGTAPTFATAADILKALGHPLRLRLVAVLAAGDRNVGTLAQTLGAPQAIVSQQLRILRMSHLVAATRSDGQAIYRLTEPRILRLLRCMQLDSTSNPA